MVPAKLQMRVVAVSQSVRVKSNEKRVRRDSVRE